MVVGTNCDQHQILDFTWCAWDANARKGPQVRHSRQQDFWQYGARVVHFLKDS
jgi:hypothetical protein